MGWVDPRVGLGWVEYDKTTLSFDDYTTYNCIGLLVELLSSSGNVYILICAYRPAQLNLSVISPQLDTL